MRPLNNQTGVSIGGVILFGAIVLVGLVYGKNVVGIAYHAYQVKSVIRSIASKETVEVEARKRFLEQLAFNQLSDVVKVEDLDIEQVSGALVLSVSYKECSKLSSTWEVCATHELTSAK